MNTQETTIHTETVLLPGQQLCIGTPYEREQLLKSPLPLPPPPQAAPVAGSTLDPEALEADPCAGWEIGSCEVIRRLSPGSVRSLLALRTDVREGSQLVVLKRLEVADDLVQALFDHSRWATALKHPNLARVFGCEVGDEGTFWVTEFAAGATLGEIATACKKAGKAIPLGLSLAAVHEAAMGLGEMHAFGTAHGLVRDQSLILTFKGATRLIDLGLRRFVKDPQGVHLAPEQQTLQPRSPDACCDVYSLGALLFECLTGRRFGDFKSLDQMLKPSSLNLAVSKELDAVVLKALSRDRADRYATANQFALALKEAAAPFMWRSSLRAEFVTALFANRKRREQVLLAGVESMRRRSSVAVKAVALPPAAPMAAEYASVAALFASASAAAAEPTRVPALPSPVERSPAATRRAQPPAARASARSSKNLASRRPGAVAWAALAVGAVTLGAAATLLLADPDRVLAFFSRVLATELADERAALLLGASTADRVLTVNAPALAAQAPVVDLAMRVGHSLEPVLVVSPPAVKVPPPEPEPAVAEAQPAPAVADAVAAAPVKPKTAVRKHRRDDAPLPPWLSGGTAKRGRGR